MGVDMMGNPAAMSTPNLNADMSMGLGNESMLFASNAPGNYQSHQMQQRMPPSRSSSQSMPAGTPSSTPQSQHLSMGDGTPRFNSALMDESFLRPHVMYYFDSVLPMQYLFQQKNAAAVIQDVR